MSRIYGKRYNHTDKRRRQTSFVRSSVRSFVVRSLVRSFARSFVASYSISFGDMPCQLSQLTDKSRRI